MLHVTYEAVEDLEPGRLARIEPARGRIRNLLDKRAPLEDVVRDLNVEIAQLVASGTWYQLWGDEIVGRDTPGAPLRVRYLLERLVPETTVVCEDKGLVSVYIDPILDVAAFAAAMNQATKELLAAGRWFQAHAGEIIDMTPEPMSQV
jgi:hypothetical protein